MRSTVTDRSFVPSTLGVRGFGYERGQPLARRSNQKRHTPVRGRKGWPNGIAMPELQEYKKKPQEAYPWHTRKDFNA